jgi:hypothetical protein
MPQDLGIQSAQQSVVFGAVEFCSNAAERDVRPQAELTHPHRRFFVSEVAEGKVLAVAVMRPKLPGGLERDCEIATHSGLSNQ